MTRGHDRPPSFLRRHLAATSDEAPVLVGLACDENLWVRRQAAQNPATPTWVLDLLVRAGAAPDLRGTTDADPDMAPSELRRLVECGPWAQQLVADHPNATSEILGALAHHPSGRVRMSVAGHHNTSTDTLSVLCADADDAIRRRAATAEHRPQEVLALMRRAGAHPQLSGTSDGVDHHLEAHELASLARLGPWGRFLAGRHPSCPRDVLTEASRDADWRVRSAVLDNPRTPGDLLAAAAGLDESASTDEIRRLSDPGATADELLALATHQQAEVRLAVARHRGASTSVIGALAVDRVAEIRRAAAGHHLMDPVELSLLVRAGSTADLARLATPDPSITPEDLDELARGGYWARQLTVRHPATRPATLARLLCDADPKLREWAAAHPAVPSEIVELLRRAGAAEDFQGIAEADAEMTQDDLRRVIELGPYGAWVVSWHPKGPTRHQQPPPERDCAP